jgi:lipid-A-disaccharide synthase
MREAGVRLLADSSELAVVGLVEVLSHLRPIRAAFRETVRLLDADPPDLSILIDYPDFNLRLAGEARRRKVPVLYFISPQVWAWRPSRVDLIRERVDRMLVILPFEEDLYRKAGVQADFVGHPLVELLPQPPPRAEAKRRLEIDPARTVVGLFPGSRRREIGFHLPVLLESLRVLRERWGPCEALLPLAPGLRAGDLEPYLVAADPPGVRVRTGEASDLLGAMDVAVVKSGTATLEAALMGVPMVIVYRTTALTHFLASRLTRVDRVGLVNIVAGKELAPELVQSACTAGRIAAELESLLRDPGRAERIRREMIALRDRLGRPGCFERVADEALDLARNGGRRPEQGERK